MNQAATAKVIELMRNAHNGKVGVRLNVNRFLEVDDSVPKKGKLADLLLCAAGSVEACVAGFIVLALLPDMGYEIDGLLGVWLHDERGDHSLSLQAANAIGLNHAMAQELFYGELVHCIRKTGLPGAAHTLSALQAERDLDVIISELEAGVYDQL